MLTIMGIKATDINVDLTNSTAQITKIMASNPRRISEIKIELHLPASISEKDKKILETAANNCPVHHSLHPEIKKDIHFFWKN